MNNQPVLINHVNEHNEPEKYLRSHSQMFLLVLKKSRIQYLSGAWDQVPSQA